MFSKKHKTNIDNISYWMRLDVCKENNNKQDKFSEDFWISSSLIVETKQDYVLNSEMFGVDII